MSVMSAPAVPSALDHALASTFLFNAMGSLTTPSTWLSSNLGELKVNLWDRKGNILPKKG